MSWAGVAAGLAAASIWGGMYVVTKVVLEIVPPFTLLTLRLLLGAACLAVPVAMRGGVRVSRIKILEALLIGALGYGVSVGLQFVGTHLSTAANASLLTSATPAFMVVFAWLVLREQPSAAGLVGLGLATLGVVAVLDPRSARLGSEVAAGNLALIGAALTWALYSVLIKRISRDVATLPLSLVSFLGGVPLSLVLSAGEWSRIDLALMTPGVIAGVLYVGVVSTAAAMYLWNKSLALLDASLAGLMIFAQPVVGAGLGAALLAEHLGAAYWVGAAFIAAGVVVATRRTSARKRTRAAPSRPGGMSE
jgi:drug/metabolite transporter (DMT)-like permease